MAHRTVKQGSYEALAERLNRFPQGAPPSDLLFKILRVLFSEREALLVSQLPIKPFSADKAAKLWQCSTAEARQRLDGLADKALLVDLVDEAGNQTWVLPPPMAGFFEFSLMRVTEEVDQKLLAELFYQYMNVEEEFIKSLFCEGKPNSAGSLSMKRRCPKTTPCSCLITSAPVKLSTPPPISGSARAIAGIRQCMSTAPVTPRSISA